MTDPSLPAQYPQLAQLADKHLENVLGEVKRDLREGFADVNAKFQQVVLRETFESEMRRIDEKIESTGSQAQGSVTKAHSRLDDHAATAKWAIGIGLTLALGMGSILLSLILR